jgi:type II secretory pathway pseudopilin PulG
MTTPTRPSQAQEGFILIEVLVSALILAIVAGAVLTLVTATTRGAATQRTHAVAYGLAQEAQAELRTMRISTLGNYSNVETRPIAGTNYTIEKQSVFVSNTTQTVSCGANDKPDYIRLTATVSAPTMRIPVTLRSVVSPTNGSLEPNVGSVQIQARNAANEPLSGVRFELVNSMGAARVGTSESTGCASFGDIPAGQYTLNSSAGELVNTEGKTSTSTPVTVATSEISRPTAVSYDKPGWIQPVFVVLNSTTSVLEPATVDSMEVFNSEAGSSTAKLWSSSPSGSRVSTLKAEKLFPFRSKYTLYAGSCEKNNPDPTGKLTANDAAMGFAEVLPGGGASPRIQLPALNLTVKYGSGEVRGAAVTVTDTKCGTKRTYVTNKAGHLAATQEGPTEAGLPWSTYTICVSAFLEGKYRKFEKSGVAVENLTTGTPLTVDFSKEGIASEKEQLKC